MRENLSKGKISLGSAIRYLRSVKGMSARSLSVAAGLSPSYVGKVEAGTLHPSFDAFCAIASVLSMTDAEIVLLIRLTQKELNETQRKPDKPLDGVSATDEVCGD